jgi:hypothetical protein
MKGYGTKEVIEFCVDCIDSIDSIGISGSQHEARLQGKGTIGKRKIKLVH